MIVQGNEGVGLSNFPLSQKRFMVIMQITGFCLFVCLFVCFGRGYIFLFFSDWLWKANVREKGNDSFLVLLELGSTDFIFCQESNKCEIL